MYQCTHCGRPADEVTGCPYCGQPPPPLAAEIQRLDRDIAEMTARDLAMQQDRTDLSSRMQAALHQRALLLGAQSAQVRRGGKRGGVLRGGGQRGTGRGRAGQRSGRRVTTILPPTVRRATTTIVPRQRRPADALRPSPDRPGDGPAASVVPVEGLRPEASSRSVQNVLLGLGAVLLAVAAAVFTAYVVTSFDPMGRTAILVVASAITLMVPPFAIRRGLTATAETVATVGLVLLPFAGVALWQAITVALPGTVFAGLVCLVTAAVALAYRAGTRLTAPRYLALVALQPAVPLLAHELVRGPADWALVLTAVAAGDAAIGRRLARRQPPAPAEGLPADPAPLRSTGWLRELTWVLHGVAVGAALVYATVALGTGEHLPEAVRAAAILLAAAGVGLMGALFLRQRPLPDFAAAVMTLAVIASASRVAAVALPGRALVLIAGAVAVTSAGVRVLPPVARRGPQVTTTGALIVMGVVTAGAALRAAVAPVQAVLPVWNTDLSGYDERLAHAVGTAGWQVAVSAVLLTFAAGLAIPVEFRREATVAGTAVSALSVPAAFALSWAVTPWVLLTAAVVLGVLGFTAPTARTARVHVLAALVVGLNAAASSLAGPELTASVMTALTLAAVLIGFIPRYLVGGPHADITGEAAQGAAAAALPGAVATTTHALLPAAGAVPVLAASFVAVSVALGYASIAQVAQRRSSAPVALGGTLGALAVAIAAFGSADATVADVLVGMLLLLGAVLLWLAPSIDAGRRADRRVDGADIAAAAVTAATIGSLARVAAVITPGTGIATVAGLVLVVALGVRAMPAHWRPGPVLGCGMAGALVGALAGYAAVVGGLRVLVAASPIWEADLTTWTSTVASAKGYGWQTPAALLLLALAATAVLPVRARTIVAPVCVGLAVIGAPAALAMPWDAPIVLGLAVGTVLGLSAVSTDIPRAGYARASVAAALAGFAVGGSLVASWATASALAGAATACALVAGAARVIIQTSVRAAANPPTHLVTIGGWAVTGGLLALPGAIAAAAASTDRPVDVILTAALATTSGGLATVALLRHYTRDYLTYAATGTALSATGIAFAALAARQHYGVYAAAAALLGVLTELLRAGNGQTRSRSVKSATSRFARSRVAASRFARSRFSRSRFRVGADSSGVLTPGLLATTAAPTLLALASIAPALTAVLVQPHKTIRHVWDGPSAAGVDWLGPADGFAVIAALVLTLAAGLAAAGFGERVATGSPRAGTAGSAAGSLSVDADGSAARRLTRDELVTQVVPVVIPGVAITLLIAPSGLGATWPAGTITALTVFTISMLGVALSPPPQDTEGSRPLRVTRWVVLAIGLAGGGAGLAGSLATRPMTLGTLAGAVGVGVTAALGGRTRTARVLGWAFASASAHMLAYVAGLAIGMPGHWSAFAVLGVAALVLVTAATLPRLQRPETRGEAPTLEWSGYAGALLALALASRSLPHLAALLAAWGAVLGVAGVRPGRSRRQRRLLLWSAVACELLAWWLLMTIADVALFEAYTLPFAALALLVGVIELRLHPELGSWAAYGPALIAAFVPTLAVVLVTDTAPLRRILLILGAAGVLIVGSWRRQRAPVVVGGIVTLIAALRELFQVSDWLIFIPIGVLLLVLGATYEKRRRDLQRLRGALTRMR